MCTVLQQHLAAQQAVANGFDLDGRSSSASGGPQPSSSTPSHFHHGRHISPVRYDPVSAYSYLQDGSYTTLKRPIDAADRKLSHPPMHFHVPGNEPSGRRSRSSYLNQLYGRSRSHSRTGMRVLVQQIQATAPRPRSPHMNNEEPIELSHYPDGRPPPSDGEEPKELPIERDDFPAPPFAYTDPKRRRRHWSAPGASEETPEHSDQDDIDSKDGDEDFHDPKLDTAENELRKISTGIGKVFLNEVAIERERRKSMQRRPLDPRSSARTPAANREPHYRLRYESPVNASPSRLADHVKPWDEDLDGTISRRSGTGTPYLPVVSPVNPPRPGYTQKASTLPSRLSPGYDSSFDGGIGDKTYSTDFSSKSDISADGKSSDGADGPRSLSPQNIHRVSSTYTPGVQKAVPARGARSTPTAPPDTPDGAHTPIIPEGVLQAPNVYPLHLLMTTNYRMPGDVDRCNLEKHLADSEFAMLFKVSREEFYQFPYWKRCEMKRRYHLF